MIKPTDLEVLPNKFDERTTRACFKKRLKSDEVQKQDQLVVLPSRGAKGFL